jgi:hypothetical protein
LISSWYLCGSLSFSLRWLGLNVPDPAGARPSGLQHLGVTIAGTCCVLAASMSRSLGVEEFALPADRGPAGGHDRLTLLGLRGVLASSARMVLAASMNRSFGMEDFVPPADCGPAGGHNRLTLLGLRMVLRPSHA